MRVTREIMWPRKQIIYGENVVEFETAYSVEGFSLSLGRLLTKAKGVLLVSGPEWVAGRGSRVARVVGGDHAL
jgi:hypothetical protein